MVLGKKRLILLFVVVLVVVMVRLPVVDAVDEYRYVDAYSDVDWNETGADPYMDAQDQPTNIISQNSNGALTGWCGFADTSGTGSGFTVVFSVYHDSTNDAYIEWELDWTSDGVAEASGSFSTAHAYAWEDDSVDLSALDTQAEIDQCRVRFTVNKGGGGPNLLEIDAARLYITGGVAGQDYTAYPSGSLALGGTTALAASFSKTLVEGFALAGVTALAAAVVVTLIQGFTLIGTTSLVGIYSKTLIEGFALAGTTSVFVIIQILIVEGFALTGGVSLVAAFVVTLAQGFALGGTTALAVAFVVTLAQGFSLGGSVSLAVAYVKTLVEGFSLAGTISAFKVFIVELVEGFAVGVGANITKIVGTVVAASMIHLLFFSTEMWGYLGPIAMVIVGYLVMTKDKNLGVVWFVVECLIIAQYFALLEATPDYWWQIFILLIGGLSTAIYSLSGRR